MFMRKGFTRQDQHRQNSSLLQTLRYCHIASASRLRAMVILSLTIAAPLDFQKLVKCKSEAFL